MDHTAIPSEPATVLSVPTRELIARRWMEAIIPSGAHKHGGHGIFAYKAVQLGSTAADAAGIAISLEHGPGVAFIPFSTLRGDETRAEIRARVAAAILTYTPNAAWVATEAEKAEAIAFCAPEKEPACMVRYVAKTEAYAAALHRVFMAGGGVIFVPADGDAASAPRACDLPLPEPGGSFFMGEAWPQLAFTVVSLGLCQAEDLSEGEAQRCGIPVADYQGAVSYLGRSDQGPDGWKIAKRALRSWWETWHGRPLEGWVFVYTVRAVQAAP